MSKPLAGDYPSFYASYINDVEGDDLIMIMEEDITKLQILLSTVGEEKSEFVYAEGRWSVKQVVGHLIDTEIIMSYRALCIARGEKQSLPGFDQDGYVKEGRFNQRKLQDLIEELILTRRLTITLFKSFEHGTLNRRGVANQKEVTVLALGFIIVGHANHHLRILKEKYLS